MNNQQRTTEYMSFHNKRQDFLDQIKFILDVNIKRELSSNSPVQLELDELCDAYKQALLVSYNIPTDMPSDEAITQFVNVFISKLPLVDDSWMHPTQVSLVSPTTSTAVVSLVANSKANRKSVHHE